MIGTPKFLSITLKKPSFFQDEPIEGKIELNITAQTVIGDISLSVFLLGSWIKSSSAQKGETIRENLLTYNLNINKLLNINSDLINLAPEKLDSHFILNIQKRLFQVLNF